MDIINIKDKSGKLYYVGGVVRDFLLGCKSIDVDMTYVGDAIEFAKAAELEILQINEAFGTVRVRIDGREVDIASTRREVYEKKGHLPTVTEIGVPLKDDVLRRDFTVNTLAMKVGSEEIVDYAGGLNDLNTKTLRVLHDESFVDDPTRIIRALKFSVRFGFKLDPHTKSLQETYLKNINYDMCYKRVKKELIETFGLNSQDAFETFIKDGIYKLVTPEKVELPKVNIEELICKYVSSESAPDWCVRGEKYLIWLVYAGVLGDLSRLPLTKNEQKILDDFEVLKTLILKTDFEIYKAFENVRIETILLYAILVNEKTARRYLDELRLVKLSITGSDLQKLGIKPSPKYSDCFDFVLVKKLINPTMTKEEELEEASCFFEC